MCGVIACWGDATRAQLEAGLDAISHRGPDGRGVWIGDGAALGHVRLAVVDLEGGAQPIANADGSIVAVVNGELYDADAERAALGRDRFRTRSDSELLVELYQEHGLACLERLRGELAFVLWDGRSRRLIAARDRFGIKPLVFARQPGAHHGGALWLASEAKALFAVGVPAAWDPEGVDQALAHQYLTPGRTLFRGVTELLPGHVLIADDAGVRVRPYGARTFEHAGGLVDDIRAAIDDAVAVRTVADVPIAAYLSGGLDSSLVTALAARRVPVTAFGIAFDHAPYDEHRDAAAFARELGIAFHPVPVSQDAILEVLPDAVERSEGLCINGQLSAKFLLSRAVRAAGYKVVLAGEGADEVFYGYAHLVHDHAELAGHPAPHHPAQVGVMLPIDRRRDLPTWLDAKREIGLRIRPLLVAPPSGDPIARLLDEVGPVPTDPVARAATLWTRLALARYILRTLGDGTEMAHGVEGRLPFLDPRVVAAAGRASPAEHLHGGIAKRLLREAARGILPEELCAREKRPLLAPPITLFATPRSADLIRDVVRGSTLRALPWFDRARVVDYIDGLVGAPPDVARAAEPVVMTILSMCALHHRLGLSA